MTPDGPYDERSELDEVIMAYLQGKLSYYDYEIQLKMMGLDREAVKARETAMTALLESQKAEESEESEDDEDYTDDDVDYTADGEDYTEDGQDYTAEPTEEPTEESVDEESTEEPTEEPTEESGVETTEDAPEEPTEDTAEESVDEDTPTEEPTEDTAEESVDEDTPTEEPTEESEEETTEETTEEPTEESEEETKDPEPPRTLVKDFTHRTGAVIGAIIGKREKKKKESSGTEKDPKKDGKPPEEPDPDSFSAHFQRWKQITFGGYVILKTLSRDEKYDGFVMETTLIRKRDLPREAVAVTGMRNTYCLDKVKNSVWYYQYHDKTHLDPREGAFTASDAALYMMSDKMDNALMVNWESKPDSPFDIKKIMMLAFLGIAVIMLFMVLR